LFAEKAGLPESMTLWIAGIFAAVTFSSVSQPGKPYLLDPVNTNMIRLGYETGRSLSVP
jgi:hypothetical protein